MRIVNNSRLSLIGVASLATLLAQSASAGTLTGNFSGVVSFGSDAAGLFGNAESLVGDSVTGTISVSDVFPNTGDDGSATYGYTATPNGAGAFITVTYTINGQTYTQTDSTGAEAYYAYSNGAYNEATLSASNVSDTGLSSYSSLGIFYNALYDGSLHQLIASGSGNGYIQECSGLGNGDEQLLGVLNLEIDSFTLGDAQIPEPGSYGLLLVPLLGLGILRWK
jgi:hypothetical protein